MSDLSKYSKTMIKLLGNKPAAEQIKRAELLKFLYERIKDTFGFNSDISQVAAGFKHPPIGFQQVMKLPATLNNHYLGSGIGNYEGEYKRRVDAMIESALFITNAHGESAWQIFKVDYARFVRKGK
ncbi:hypothetical protein EniLVp02_0238 [Vibrio phage EniLVp02]